MAGNYEDMPYVGEAGRKVMEAETADELKSAVSGGSEPQRVSVDSLDGAGTTGKAVMKANDPAAYTLPAATANALGGVKQVTLAEDASAADIVTALKAAGIAK